MFQHCLGEGGREKGRERRTRIAHIMMEACTVNFLLFEQNLTSVPKSFDPHCTCEKLLTKPKVTVQELAEAIGIIVSNFPGVEFGPLF